jgi:chromosome segregation protein
MSKTIYLDKYYCGAEWARVDLHLHTPGSKSFKLPSGINLESSTVRNEITKNYINKLKEGNIKIGAITDYNGIRKEWFTLIRKEAEKENIFIFPGVELSFNDGKCGLHILAIFEYNCQIDGINSFIQSLDMNPQEPLLAEKRENRDITAKSNPYSAIIELKEKFKPIIIYPHPEDTNGLCKTFQKKQVADYIKISDGIEYITDQMKDKIISTGKIVLNFFDKFAIIENSDPKSINEIGNKKRNNNLRATYFKLSSFDLSSLKVALHDPEVRVRTYNIPSFYHDRLSRVKITGSSFLKEIDIFFNSDLNTFVGGRGVGKSAIIESIRYATNLPVHSERSSQIDFIESVVGSGGQISVFIKRYYGKEKKEYEIKRIIGKDTEIFEDGVKTDFSVQSLFQESKYPIIIGQKELYLLSITPEFQMKLIDEIIGEKILDGQKVLNNLIKQVKDNGQNLLYLKSKIEKIEDHEQKLKEIEAQIKVYRDLGAEEKLKKWTDILDDEEKLKNTTFNVKEIIKNINTFFDNNISNVADIINDLKAGKSVNNSILIKGANELNSIKIALEQIKVDLNEKFNQSQLSLEQLYAEWGNMKSNIDISIQNIKKDLGKKDLEPEKFERLTRERSKLLPLIKGKKGIENNIKNCENDRSELIEKIKRQRHAIFAVRQNQVEKINTILKGRLNIKVKYEEEKINFKEELQSLLSGSSVTKNAIELLTNSKNKLIDGILLSKYIQEGCPKLQEDFNLTIPMAIRLTEWFKDKEKLYTLETIYPEDKIEIYLKINNEYKIINKLSIGQKATALLLLLFAQENRIIILDQPEEDLDNRFVYEDVVKILREMKGKRQLFIATHNANIPVLGDSELILVLDTKDDRCYISNKGSIDKTDIKTDVKSIMEGGEEAFRIRAEKYGGI